MTGSSPDSAPPFSSLLIVRLSAMGDIIHTLPAAAALRQAYPRATLGWLVEERWAELLCTLRYPRSGSRSPQRPLVDRVHAVNTAAWRRAPFSFNTWQQMAVSLSQVRGIRYEAAIDFQGAARSALLARWSGAPVVYGSAQPRENVASMFYTRQVLLQANRAHVIEQGLTLAAAVTDPATIPHTAGRFSPRPGCGKQNCRPPVDRKKLCHSQSRRGLGSEEVARRALRAGRAGVGVRRNRLGRKLRSRRRSTGRGRGNRQRGSGTNPLLLGFRVDRADPPRPALHWRRHRAVAPGSRIENSSGRNFWSHQSRAEWAFRNTLGGAPKREQCHRSRPAPRAGTRIARDHRQRRRHGSSQPAAERGTLFFPIK